MGRLSTVLRGLLIWLDTVMLAISERRVRGRPYIMKFTKVSM